MQEIDQLKEENEWLRQLISTWAAMSPRVCDHLDCDCTACAELRDVAKSKWRPKPMSDDNRPFPIMEDVTASSEVAPPPAGTIPWWLAEAAYKTYIRLHGRCLTLEMIAGGGGFGRAELLDLLKGQVLQGR